MKTVSAHRQGYLEGTSFTGNSAGELARGQYDLLIVTSSWDERCLSVPATSLDLHARRAIGVFFDQRDSLGLRDKHDPLVAAFCTQCAVNFLRVEGDSRCVDAMWSRLRSEIDVAFAEIGAPLRVFVDVSTCPRYLFLAVLAYGIHHGMIRDISLFYTEGLYPAKRDPLDIALTRGKWETVPVPELTGMCDPGKRRFYLVSVGFEGWKTFRVVSKADPDRVAVLFPDPGVRVEYSERTLADNTELIRQFGIPESQVFRYHASDAIGAWSHLAKMRPERPERENSYYLCCGSKPHAIALALRAMVTEWPAVLYNVPEEHRVHQTTAAGTYWRYDIQDLTAAI